MLQLFRPFVSADAISAVQEVLESGWIGLGPRTAEFESQFAEYVGAKFAVAVNSATSALHLAAIVSGISQGDEVLSTPMTFVSTNHVILYQGATPVFVDVDERTLNINLNAAERLVTPRTRAIIAVHYAGNPVNIDELYNFARRHHLAVIEDAAHACGASFCRKRVGSFGLTCFSFHAVKNLPIGDGGMITTNDEDVYRRLVELRWLGIDRSTFSRTGKTYQWEYDIAEVGYKYHMNDISAAIGIAHLKMLAQWNARRRAIVDMYRAGLAGLEHQGLRFLEETSGAESSNHLCVIRVPRRDFFADRLKEMGIGTGVHYKPNHYYPMYRNAKRSSLTIAETAYTEIMSLPLHLLLSDEDVSSVCAAIRNVFTLTADKGTIEP